MAKRKSDSKKNVSKPGALRVTAKDWTGALPCLFLVLMGFGVLMLLFYWGLRSQ